MPLSLLSRVSPALLLVLAIGAIAPASVVINEVVASNSSSLADEDGDYPDWIELINTGESPVDLAGWKLSDRDADPDLWNFPPYSIAPGEHLVVFASGKDRIAGPNLHTNFSISAAGEPILLSDSASTLVDSAPAVAIPRDVSLGRFPDGTGPWRYFTTPTPGAANTGDNYGGLAAIPVFSHTPGFYPAPINLGIGSTDLDVTIRYTLDGSVPDESSPIFDSALLLETRDGDPNVLSIIRTAGFESPWLEPSGEVQKAHIIRARAFREDWLPSSVLTGTYLVHPLAGARYSLSVLSMVSPFDNLFSDATGIMVPGDSWDSEATNSNGNNPTGNYHFRTDEWERPVHLELWDPTGQREVAIDAGLRIHGGVSRAYDRKSLRIYFRTDYGASTLEHPVFDSGDVSTFHRLLLRAGSQDRNRTILRDEIASEILGNLNVVVSSRWRPVIMLVNGEYWGLMHFGDRIDPLHLQTHLGVDPANLDILSRGGDIEEGDAAHWNAFLTALENADKENPAHYLEMSRWVDFDSYWDYLAGQIFIVNTDWPDNNTWMWRVRRPGLAPVEESLHPDDGRWRWYIADLDQSLDFDINTASEATLDRIAADVSINAQVINQLLEFPEFRARFANRLLDRLNADFLPSRTVALLDRAETLLDPEIDEHLQRWPIFPSRTAWEQDVGRVRNFLNNRPAALRAHLNSFFAYNGQRTVTVDVHPRGTGNVAINSWQPDALEYPVSGIYLSGNPIELHALPAWGYRFVGWIGGAVINNSTIESVLVDPADADNVVALFEPDPAFDWTGIGPPPFVLAGNTYTLNSFASTTPAGTWPPHMILRQSAIQDPPLDVLMNDPWLFPYNLDSRSRFVGLDADGIGFLNTGTAQDGGGYMGAADLALNTIGVAQARASFTLGTVLPNNRPYAIRLQARTDPDSPWFDVLGANSNVIEYTRNTTAGHATMFGPITLPESLLDRPYAQLRWRYHALPTSETGPRAFLRLDAIAVQGDSVGSSLWMVR